MNISKQALRLGLSGVIAAMMLVASVGVWADHRPGHEGKGGGKPSDGSGSDSGDDIKLSCFLAEGNGENIRDDNRSPAFYDDADRKVTCSTGGTSQPNLSGILLDTVAKGNPGNRERQLDLVLMPCSAAEAEVEDRCMEQVDFDNLAADLPAHMRIFAEGFGGASSDNPYDMEDVTFHLRPYKAVDLPGDNHHHGGDHLQKLDPGVVYRMALRIWLKHVETGDPRVVINLAGHHVPGDKSQGVSCAHIPDPTVAVTEDVYVKVHGEGDHPLLYSVATFNPDTVPSLNNGFMLASICSNMPPVGDCGNGKDASNLCYLHGFVKVKLNFMASELL